ncbi:MAG: alpha/beta hydrolase [Nannocystaceae bacterium]
MRPTIARAWSSSAPAASRCACSCRTPGRWRTRGRGCCCTSCSCAATSSRDCSGRPRRARAPRTAASWCSILPGAGESDRPRPPGRPRLRAVVAGRVRGRDAFDVLGVEQLDVVGHGVGALVGMALAVLRPQQVGAVVAIAPCWARCSCPTSCGSRRCRAGRVRDGLPRRGSTPHLASWRAVPATAALAPALYWDRLARDGGLAAARALLLQLERTPALAAAYAPLSCPTLLVWADRDGAIAAADRQGWTAALPHAASVVIEGCGHAIPEEQPRALAAAIDGFLGERAR